MKKIIIKVTVEDVTPGDMELSKRFFTAFEQPDGITRVTEHVVSDAEEKILESICMRIRQDRKNLIDFVDKTREEGYMSGKIVIIPAVDYIPE